MKAIFKWSGGLVETVTDNRNRTVAEIRHVFTNLEATWEVVDQFHIFLKKLVL